MALASKVQQKSNRVYTLLGDGEIQEGQVWEACMFASHYHLDNLCVIIDNNGLQIDGSVADVMSPYPIVEKLASFGFNTVAIDGHDFDQIEAAMESAKTTKGKVLGYVGDATFDEKTGAVADFLIGDGGVAESLVGQVRVPASMLVGYERGWMLLAPEAADQQLTGGLAAKAGEATARAKIEGAKAAEAAGDAIDKGSRALGKQLGKTKGMFGSFVDEFKKASQYPASCSRRDTPFLSSGLL
jgi:hypothetical protein